MPVEEIRKGKRARITKRGPQQIEISDLAKGEHDMIESAMLGLSWIRRGQDGRIETMTAVQAVAGPTEDEDILPFWRPLRRDPKGVPSKQLELFEFGEVSPHSFPSITITSLCGYYYTPENYRAEAKKLEGWGFECLRSRRDESGRYWEQWCLSSLFMAKGALKEAIEWSKEVERDEFGYPVIFDPKITYTKIPEEKKLETAISFLGRNCQFGSLEVGVQRLAMAVD